MEWLRNLSNAINYIENNLSGEICYEEAAKIACCSPYYFQRMFTYVAGIPLSEYIRRRRMTQAAFDLQSSKAKVLDVAIKYGYTSPTAFNRAFQSVHGISPISAKSLGHILNAYPPIRFSVQIAGGHPLPYRIEQKEALRVVGIRVRLTEDMDENKIIVPAYWNEILQTEQFVQICHMSDQPHHGVLGITAYQSPGEVYYYISTVTDQTAAAGMFEYIIPSATWVIFECDGLFKESVQNIFKTFLTEWLPFSGYVYAELPDIEVYPFSKENIKEGHSEVWIAIKKEKGK